MKKHRGYLILTVIITMLITALVLTFVSRIKLTYNTPVVRTTSVRNTPIEHSWSIPAVVDANVIKGVSLIPGVHIEEVYVENSTHVKKGDKLLKLSASEISALLSEAYVEKRTMEEDIRYTWYKDERDSKNEKLNVLMSKIERMEKLIEDNGNVFADQEGIIKIISCNPGDVTKDEAMLQIGVSGTETKCRFKIKEDEVRYFTVGNDMDVLYDEKKYQAKIENCIMSAEDTYEIIAAIENADMLPGEIVIVSYHSKNTEFDYVIPLSALHNDGTDYIYVERYKDTILGEEMYADLINVTVKDKNDEYAGINSMDLEEDDKIIFSSDKEVTDGCRIRE